MLMLFQSNTNVTSHVFLFSIFLIRSVIISYFPIVIIHSLHELVNIADHVFNQRKHIIESLQPASFTKLSW